MNLLPNIILVVIVCIFWGGIAIRVRAMGRRISLNLMILPLFFIVLGIVMNGMNGAQHWLGTYAIGGVHVILLIIMMVKLSGGQPKL